MSEQEKRAALLPDARLTAEEAEALMAPRDPGEPTSISKARRRAYDKLRAALSAPQEEGEGKSSGVELEQLKEAVTELQATMYLTGSPPKDQDEALTHLAGVVDRLGTNLQGEIKRLRDIEKDCAEVAADALEEEGERSPLRAELARIQSEEAGSTAERLESIVTQQSVPEHSGETPEQIGCRIREETERSCGGEFSPEDRLAIETTIADAVRENFCPCGKRIERGTFMCPSCLEHAEAD